MLVSMTATEISDLAYQLEQNKLKEEAKQKEAKQTFDASSASSMEGGSVKREEGATLKGASSASSIEGGSVNIHVAPQPTATTTPEDKAKQTFEDAVVRISRSMLAKIEQKLAPEAKEKLSRGLEGTARAGLSRLHDNLIIAMVNVLEDDARAITELLPGENLATDKREQLVNVLVAYKRKVADAANKMAVRMWNANTA